MTQRRPRVAIVGGGFGGLAAARGLARADCEVVVIDRANYHCFQPLLYQVATAALSPADIAHPIRAVVRRQRNCAVRLGTVVGIRTVERTLLLASGEQIGYDYLILATGATHAYFGRDEWEGLAPGLKTVDDAIRIRGSFLRAFEEAEAESDEARRQALLTFAVVGGGPTGIELAGAMAEVARRLLPGDFRKIRPDEARIILIEAEERLLRPYAPESSAAAAAALQRLGVELWLGQRVEEIRPGQLQVDGRREPCANVFWAAGVAASPLAAELGVALDRAGRVEVGADLSCPGHPEILVIGDLAAVRQGDGQLVPGVAPAAIQMGDYAARRVEDLMLARETPAFRYRDKGKLAVIGRGQAVGEVGRWRFRGVAAWLGWALIHIWFLIGFRNRFLVMLAWAWSYFDFYRGARLITVEDGNMQRTA